MSDFSPVTAGIIFVTYVVVDILYAAYIICVEQRKPKSAAAISAALYSLLAFGVITYSKNPLYLIPLAAGAAIGTFVTVSWSKS